ncbi:homeobox protein LUMINIDEPENDENS isoform X2 [Rutidosis leptorrhynchoides]|uniref:homeobox protein LUMINIDEPENDENS isoform X2 n=1 Tax=Rutidosis leptorrhynchoides TaxID=125765 RepID=UPI003A99CAE5
MAISKASDQVALVVSSNPTTSYESLLESQKELISKQIYELQNIVITQCKLTGVNPLSQEMAAGALSINIGKRPRDLLNPKAIKYMQSIFSVKDEIRKKEIRAICALFGLTATQVKEYFNSQRSKVRRFMRLSREKAIQSAEGVQQQDGSLSSNVETPAQPVPLNSMGPPIVEAPSTVQAEVLPDTNDSDKFFMSNIFSMLRKEETFSGQVKLMEWILQIQNDSVLYWFLTNGGVMILASWLSQAAIEEQTTVLHVILRVLCHLPLHKALPAHMSAILQSVNKLRFYRGSDISNRAKKLLSRWSKIFARSQANRKPNTNISPVDAQNEMLLKQSIVEIMENESLESTVDNPGAIYALQENSENSRPHSVKLLTAPSDDPNTKLPRGVSSSHARERRKVQLVEQPGQKAVARTPQVTRVITAPQGRPLSADDIQKAKMRAQFMRNKYGESYKSPQKKTEVPHAKTPVHPKVEEHATSSSMTRSPAKVHVKPPVHVHPKVEGPTGSSSMSPLTAKVQVEPLVHDHSKVEEHFDTKAHAQPIVEKRKMPANNVMSVDEPQKVLVNDKKIIDSEEPVWKKCKRLQISWIIPPEMMINKEWSVCCGENSKEVDIQNNRIKREKEVFYKTKLEIPSNPKEPWDIEMDYDDSLTPEIPSEQPPDDDNNMVVEPTPDPTNNNDAGPSTVAENNKNMPEPDLELLAVLLKNPEIVFALTAGQGGNLTNEQMVRLLDVVKANAASGGSISSLVNGLVERKTYEKVEVSLPSPTPSNDRVTSGWQPEIAKNPFSRQTVTLNSDPYAIQGAHFQESSLLASTTTVTPWAQHQRFSDFAPDQRNIQANANQLYSDMVLDQRNIQATEHGLALQGTSNSYLWTERSGSQLQSQRHVIHEPQFPQVQSWTGRNSLGPGPYSQTEYNNTSYNAYGTGEFVQPGVSRTGPTWERNGGSYRGEPGFETWSPTNSPIRSNVDRREYLDPHGQSYNYRQDMSRMQPDASRYRNLGGRNDGSRWRDRRR